MSKYYRLLPLALATVVSAAAVPAPAGAAALPKASTVQPQQSRLGFRSGARRAPAFGVLVSRMTHDVPIQGETIRLGQLLKLAGIVGAGGEARAFLGTHRV